MRCAFIHPTLLDYFSMHSVVNDFKNTKVCAMVLLDCWMSNEYWQKKEKAAHDNPEPTPNNKG